MASLDNFSAKELENIIRFYNQYSAVELIFCIIKLAPVSVISEILEANKCY